MSIICDNVHPILLMLHAPQLSADHNTAGGVNHKLLQISCDSLMSAAWFFIVCVLRDASLHRRIARKFVLGGLTTEGPKAPKSRRRRHLGGWVCGGGVSPSPERGCPAPQPTRGLGSVVSSPSGFCGI